MNKMKTLKVVFKKDVFQSGSDFFFFFDVTLLPEIFRWNNRDQKSRAPFTFHPDFSETFCKQYPNKFQV